MAIAKKKIRLSAREKRKIRIRNIISGSDERPRLCIFKSVKHTTAQLISDINNTVIASASTQEAEVLTAIKSVSLEGSSSQARSTKSLAGARAVGLVVAKRGLAKNIKQVVFDRNGNLYHGRVKALADGAREGGLEF